MNLREEDSKPELDCVGSSPMDREKVFKISFSGDVTYDNEKSDGAVHYWLCRRNNTEPTFIRLPSGVQPTTSPSAG
jgi:hypothetical protein